MTITKKQVEMACGQLAETLASEKIYSFDGFEQQYKDYGFQSVLMRLDEKVARLKYLSSNEIETDFANVDDTLLEVAGCAVLGLLARIGESQATETERLKTCEDALKFILDDTKTIADYDDTISGIRSMAMIALDKI